MPLTQKQIRFIEEYPKDWNATKAAIRAGYSKRSAGIQGFDLLRNKNVKENIDKKLSELSLSSNEVLKHISDIAKSNLNDYFTKKQVISKPKVIISLNELIIQLIDKIEDFNKFIDRAGLSGDDLAIYEDRIKKLKLQIIEYQIELERSPDATRIVDGDPELVEVVELDLKKLVADKNSGKIKSYSVTENGPKIELCSPDNALINLAKIHGLFEKDNKQKGEAVRTLLTNDPLSDAYSDNSTS